MDDRDEFDKVLATVFALLVAEGHEQAAEVLRLSVLRLEVDDDRHGYNRFGTTWNVYLGVEPAEYARIGSDIDGVTTLISTKLALIVSQVSDDDYAVRITPNISQEKNWRGRSTALPSHVTGAKSDEELLRELEQIKGLLVSVSTGGPRINDVEPQYKALISPVLAELARRGMSDAGLYSSLWDWYGRWANGDLPSYQSRREFIAGLMNPIVSTIRTGVSVEAVLATGWERVDRCLIELRERLAGAKSEEQFQAVGLLGREALISLAQAVFVPDRHPSLDGVVPSRTDGKRMLEAFITVELAGGANEEFRKHARSALEFAVALQHRRTATFRDAALCAEATDSVINVIAIVAGRRDP